VEKRIEYRGQEKTLYLRRVYDRTSQAILNRKKGSHTRTRKRKNNDSDQERDARHIYGPAASLKHGCGHLPARARLGQREGGKKKGTRKRKTEGGEGNYARIMRILKTFWPLEKNVEKHREKSSGSAKEKGKNAGNLRGEWGQRQLMKDWTCARPPRGIDY